MILEDTRRDELLEALGRDIGLARGNLAAWLDAIAEASQDDPAYAEAFAAYRDQVERTGDACSLLGLAGLAACCAHLCSALLWVSAGSPGERRRAKAWFARWPDAFVDYLAAPAEPAEAAAVAELMTARDAPLRMSVERGLDVAWRLAGPAEAKRR
jgi:hypothetical protein